jgi:hypothetical protein
MRRAWRFQFHMVPFSSLFGFNRLGGLRYKEYRQVLLHYVHVLPSAQVEFIPRSSGT